MTLPTLAPYAQGNAFWRSGGLWFCHTAGGSAGRGIVYYYDIATNSYPNGTPTLAESGFIDGGPSLWNYMPAIGGNSKGEVCLVFTQSSTQIYPTIMVTARQAGADAFPTPIAVRTSSVAYNPGTYDPRWGDYATVSVDPTDTTLWVGSELVASSNANDWTTEIANVAFPGPSTWVANGVPLRQSASGASLPSSAPDGVGGVLTAWVDSRTAPPNIFVQRTTSTGAIASGWPNGGEQISSVSSDPVGGTIAAPDGNSGAFVAWYQVGGIRIQHVTGSGAISAGWPAQGVSVTTTSASPAMIADGAGGATVAWSSSGIHVRHVTAGGTVQWGSDDLSTSGSGPTMASDGSGGVIIAWNPSVRVQRVDASGNVQWAAGGVSLATGSNAQIAVDGSGGALIAYQKTGTGQDIYLVRINSAGAVYSGWPTGGVAACGAAGDQTNPRITSDGSSGALLSWTDFRSDASGDIYAQRVTGTGSMAPGWPTNGTGVCTAAADQSGSVVVSDSLGGAVIAWQDGRSDEDIFCQHVSNEGTVDASLPTNGLGICTAAGEQALPALVVTQRGVAVLAWQDARLYSDCTPFCSTGIYAMNFSFDAVAPTAVTNLANTSTQRGPHTIILTWTESGDDGMTGPANHFDVRYSSSTITASNFFSATPITPPSPTGVPGSLDCLTVNGLTACHTYYFAMKTYDEAGNASLISNVVSVATKCSGNDVDCGSSGFSAARDPLTEPSDIPAVLEFAPTSPNPSSRECALEFGVPADQRGAEMSLEIVDIAGRRVQIIAQGVVTPGRYHEQWDLKSASHSPVSPGLFFARLRVGQLALTRRIIVVRP